MTTDVGAGSAREKPAAQLLKYPGVCFAGRARSHGVR